MNYATRSTITAVLYAALPLLSLAWALDVIFNVGVNLFAEQFLAAMLAIAWPLAFFQRSIAGVAREQKAKLYF